jgi:L-asparagine transporter-like permease
MSSANFAGDGFAPGGFAPGGFAPDGFAGIATALFVVPFAFGGTETSPLQRPRP